MAEVKNQIRIVWSVNKKCGSKDIKWRIFLELGSKKNEQKKQQLDGLDNCGRDFVLWVFFRLKEKCALENEQWRWTEWMVADKVQEGDKIVGCKSPA